MNLIDVQDRMRQWAGDHLTTTDPAMAALKVAEEAGELAGAVVKPLDGARAVGGELAGEIADVILAAVTCAEFAGIDAGLAVKAKLAQLEARPLPLRFGG